MNIICAGEMLVDIMVRTVDKVAFQNDTCPVEDIHVTGGGDAHNNAVDLVKLGHRVAYMGLLGCDGMGGYVARLASDAGVDMSHAARSSTTRQPQSIILVGRDGSRTFLQYAGTSGEFCFEDCDLSLLDGADALQIGGALHLPRFDGEGSAKLLAAAKEKGLTTFMDITTDRTGRWKGILDPCWPYLDYFLPSIEQASMVAGTDEPRAIAEHFLRRGVQNVAVKLGDCGSYFKNRETAFYAGTYKGLSVVETTGAGDAFCAGFITGVGEGLAPVECISLASACSAQVIQAAGATAGMKSLSEIRAFMASQPPLTVRLDQ